MTINDIGGLADQLGLWFGTRWMLTAFPAWMLLVVPFILSIGSFLVVRTCVELRAPKLHKQYTGFWPGNVFASLALGLLIVGMVFYTSPMVDPFWRSMAWNAATFLVAFGTVLGLAIIEYRAAAKARKSSFRSAYAYTFYQLHTPTAILFRFTMFALLYLFMKVGVVALCTGAVPWSLKLAAIILLAAWACCVILDNTRPRPNLSDVYPTSGAWFRIGQKEERPVYTFPAPSSAVPARESTGGWETGETGETGFFQPRTGTDTDGYGYGYGRPQHPGATSVDNFRTSGTGRYNPANAPASSTSTRFPEEMPPPRSTAPGEPTGALPPFGRGSRQSPPPRRERPEFPRAVPSTGDNAGTEGSALPPFRKRGPVK